MRRIFTSVAPTVITGIAGTIMLVSLLLGGLPGFAWLIGWRTALVDVAVIVAGVAIVMGFAHLLYVHLQRIRQRQSVFYSIVLMASAVVTLILLLLDRATADRAISRFVLEDIILPMQSAYGALLAVFLVVAALRLTRRKRAAGGLWFLLAALIVLLTQVPLPFGGLVGQVAELARQIIDALTTAGMRGLLLGVALGTLATAFRVLFFIDRPQSE